MGRRHTKKPDPSTFGSKKFQLHARARLTGLIEEKRGSTTFSRSGLLGSRL